MFDHTDISRRTVLEATGSATILALAGCVGAPRVGGQVAAKTVAPTTDGGGMAGMDDFASRDEVRALPSAPVQEATVEMTMVSETEPVFDPEVIWVAPGGTVTWKNVDEDPHTSTSYSADNGKPQRIPDGASGWNSGILQTDDTFTQTFETEGVYDYYCLPHEALGMVGCVIVGRPDANGQPGLAPAQGSLPEKARSAIGSLNDRVTRVLDR